MLARRAAGDRQKLAVGAEMNRIRPLPDAGDAAEQLAVGRIPDSDLVIAADQKLRAIGAEFDRGDRASCRGTSRARAGCVGGGIYEASGALAIGAIERQARFDPLFEQRRLCSAGSGSPSSGIRSFTSVEVIRRKASLPSRSLAVKPGCVESPAAVTSLERIDAIAAFGLLRARDRPGSC